MILALLALLAPGCGERAEPAAGPAEVRAPATASQPDLVVVTFLKLRGSGSSLEDGEGALVEGMGRPPDRRFTAAYAQSTHPFTSLGSLLTGFYPSAVPLCGLTEDGEANASARPWCARLPPERHALAEVLGLYGYRSLLLTSGLPGAELLEDGFDRAEHLRPTDGAVSDWAALADQASRWWAEAPGQPRLLVLALSDLAIDQDHALMDRALGQRADDRTHKGETVDVALLQGAYRDRARETGQKLSGLLAQLDLGARPAWTFVAGITGVTLGELDGWQRFGATPSLQNVVIYDRTVHVPLLAWGPGGGGQTEQIGQPVELLDLVPTLTQLAGAVPPAGLVGQDLLAEPFVEDPDAVAYAEFGDMLSLRQGRWLYSLRTFFHGGSALDPDLTARLLAAPGTPGNLMLNDVEADPLQRTNLVEREPEVAARLQARMVEVRTGPAAPAQDALTVERLWDLRMTGGRGYW